MHTGELQILFELVSRRLQFVIFHVFAAKKKNFESPFCVGVGCSWSRLPFALLGND